MAGLPPTLSYQLGETLVLILPSLTRPWPLDHSPQLPTSPPFLFPGSWPQVAAVSWFIRAVVVPNGAKNGLGGQTDLSLNSGP